MSHSKKANTRPKRVTTDSNFRDDATQKVIDQVLAATNLGFGEVECVLCAFSAPMSKDELRAHLVRHHTVSADRLQGHMNVAALLHSVVRPETMESTLDEAVLNVKEAEASSINNDGFDRQVAYLADEGYSAVDIAGLIGDTYGPERRDRFVAHIQKAVNDEVD